MNLSITEQDYLKAIFSITRIENRSANTNAIAELLNTKASSVTDMIKKLAIKKLVNYEKYKPVHLTAIGQKTATSLIRSHRLWETFLVERLEYDWSQVHSIAEQLEHIEDDELLDKLDNYLGNPKFDPHGDPIPSPDGTFPQRDEILLSHLNAGDCGRICSVLQDDESFLEALNEMNISMGITIEFVKKIEFDQSIQLIVNNQKIILSESMAANISIQKI